MKLKNAEILKKKKNGGVWGLNHRPLDNEHSTLPTELLKLAEVKHKIVPSSLCCNAKMVLNSILGTKYSATGHKKGRLAQWASLPFFCCVLPA